MPRSVDHLLNLSLSGADDGTVTSITTAGHQYLIDQRRRGYLAAETIRNSRYVLASFTRVVGPQVPVRRLKRSDIERWVSAHDVAPSTIRVQMSSLRRFFDWCVIHELIRANPMLGIDPPRAKRRLPRELSPEDVERVLRVADSRERVCVLLGVQEGLRCMEIAGLQLGDIDREHVATVRGKGGHERMVPVSDQTWSAIEAYCTWRSGPVIRSLRDPDQGITANRVSLIVSDLFRRAGVKQAGFDGRSAHALRHTCAGDMLDEGADLRDVQEMLGHVHLATTSIYTKRHSDIQRLRQAAAGRRY